MITLNMGNARGYTLNKPDGSYRRITQVDPYERMLIWDGLSYIYNGVGDKRSDPCVGFMSWDDMKRDYGVEIVPTPEEAVMIERGRLGVQVQIKAKEFVEAVNNWLSNEKSR